MARKLLFERSDRPVEARLSSSSPLFAPPIGDRSSNAPFSPLDNARDVFAALAKAQAGLVFEDSTTEIALRYRGAPRAEAAVIEAAERLANGSGLVLQRGVMVVRLSPPRARAAHHAGSGRVFEQCRK